jgi:hypothetical protein
MIRFAIVTWFEFEFFKNWASLAVAKTMSNLKITAAKFNDLTLCWKTKILCEFEFSAISLTRDRFANDVFEHFISFKWNFVIILLMYEFWHNQILRFARFRMILISKNYFNSLKIRISNRFISNFSKNRIRFTFSFMQMIIMSFT